MELQISHTYETGHYMLTKTVLNNPERILMNYLKNHRGAELLTLLGYCNVYGSITPPNTGSVKLHESFFFNPIGTYRHVGYKNGKWHDVIWYGRIIRNITEMPDKPTPIKDADYTAINYILNSSF